MTIAGLAMDQNDWQYQLPASKKQYQTITFDNRGAGKSDKPKVLLSQNNDRRHHPFDGPP